MKKYSLYNVVFYLFSVHIISIIFIHAEPKGKEILVDVYQLQGTSTL